MKLNFSQFALAFTLRAYIFAEQIFVFDRSKKLNFAKLIFAVGSCIMKFSEFIFAMGRFKRSQITKK